MPGVRVCDGAILFVHGIGSQKPGETLERWSPPLLGYLKAAAAVNAKAPAGRVDRSRALLVDVNAVAPATPKRLDHELANASPAAYEHWTLRGRGEGSERRWLVAESCWASSFPLPSGLRMTRWMVAILPTFLIYHWVLSGLYSMLLLTAEPAAPVTRRGRAASLGRKYAHGARLFVSFVNRSFAAYWAFALLAGDKRMPDVVGDSLAALTEESSLDAMLAQIERDLRWCLDRVAHDSEVVIVAHSQGAMLVRELLERSDSEEYKDRLHLVTVGSGVLLLHGLRGADRPQRAAWAWVSLASLGLWAFWTLLLAWSVPHGRGPSPVGVITYLSAVAVGIVAARWAGISQIVPSFDRLALTGKVKRWVDISSRFDPVCCGPLLAAFADEGLEVANGPTVFQEHNQYHRNPAVHLVLGEMVHGPTGLALADASLHSALVDAARTAGWRTFRALRWQVAGLYAAGTIVTFLVTASAIVSYG